MSMALRKIATLAALLGVAFHAEGFFAPPSVAPQVAGALVVAITQLPPNLLAGNEPVKPDVPTAIVQLAEQKTDKVAETLNSVTKATGDLAELSAMVTAEAANQASQVGMTLSKTLTDKATLDAAVRATTDVSGQVVGAVIDSSSGAAASIKANAQGIAKDLETSGLRESALENANKVAADISKQTTEVAKVIGDKKIYEAAAKATADVGGQVATSAVKVTADSVGTFGGLLSKRAADIAATIKANGEDITRDMDEARSRDNFVASVQQQWDDALAALEENKPQIEMVVKAEDVGATAAEAAQAAAQTAYDVSNVATQIASGIPDVLVKVPDLATAAGSSFIGGAIDLSDKVSANVGPQLEDFSKNTKTSILESNKNFKAGLPEVSRRFDRDIKKASIDIDRAISEFKIPEKGGTPEAAAQYEEFLKGWYSGWQGAANVVTDIGKGAGAQLQDTAGATGETTSKLADQLKNFKIPEKGGTPEGEEKFNKFLEGWYAGWQKVADDSTFIQSAGKTVKNVSNFVSEQQK
ncbi:unnamed protein product [Chrysoparadoxa australica]